MGLVLAAELNGYPDPTHVPERADRLGLTGIQRARTQALFAAMKAETAPLGESLIAQEAALDEQFSGRTITPRESRDGHRGDRRNAGAATVRAAQISPGHVDVLTPEQVRRCAELHGYAGSGDKMQHMHHHPR